MVADDEVLIFKDTFLTIFIDSYHHHNVYGLLLTTNDNHHLINQVSLTDPLLPKYLTFLLTSNISKINKSSLLWLLYKKLLCVGSLEHHQVWDTIIVSATKHPNNYYCWEFARFFFNWCLIHDKPLQLDKIELFCKSNVTDNSAWCFLGYLFTLDMIDPFYYQWYVKICHELEVSPVLSPVTHYTPPNINSIIQFISSSHITSSIPFQFLTPFHDKIPPSFYTMHPVDDSTDLLNQENQKINKNKSRLVESIKRYKKRSQCI